jgi:hypothetical protein
MNFFQMNFHIKTWMLLGLAVGFLSAGFRPCWADGNPSDYFQQRTYFGIEGISVSVGNKGEFTGLNYSLVNSPEYEVDLLPELSQAFGFGLMFGHREGPWALEVSYWQSVHTATFGPGTVNSFFGTSANIGQQYKDTATYYSINVDFKRYLFTEQQLQPFISLGVCFPWIVVDNAAENAEGAVGPLTLAGLGLNLGVGLEYYISPEFSILAGGYQRWASFDEFKGFQTQYDQVAQYGQNTSDEGGGVDFVIGTTLGFE